MIAIVVAVSENGVIGDQGKIPWHLPADMQRFKQLTTGHTVIMGRKTWESLPDRFRPLPDRYNIVLTRDAMYRAEGGYVTFSLESALMPGTPNTVFVIGGSEIYAQALPLADRVYLTKVHAMFPGDTYFPWLGKKDWQLVSVELYSPDEKNPYSYEFRTYERIR